MEMPDLVGRFDLDLTLRDASLDPANRATRRMLAAAAIGTEVNDGYYAAVELREAVQWVHEGEPGAKLKLSMILGNQCDDYQRCLYFILAGRGIVHSERSPPEERQAGPRLYGMQTWLALPDDQEEIDPAFEAQTGLPVVEDTCAKATVIMGSLWGQRAPTTTHAETIYAEIVLAPGGALPIDAEADERAVMLVGGEASLDGQALAPYTLNVLAPGAPMQLNSERGGRVMLLGGEAFATKRHVWWNFVSSSRDRINQAKEDWRSGQFPTVPGDEAEFIPIPDQPKTVSYP